ncbi:hypothetical protein SLS53_003784 [Cytospora paraplurivora]|uniref:Uncharacterized protein n=1 Tax=Cytospora paraplurivora TaxID=2898453 RepID=A0AAN9YIF5_9PEZI
MAKLPRMSEEVAKLSRMSEELGKLPAFAINIDTRVAKVEEQVAKLPAFGLYVDTRIAKVEEQVDREVSEVARQVDTRIAKVKTLFGREVLTSEQRVEDELSRMNQCLVDFLETRRSQMWREIEWNAERVLRELRQEISRGRVSDVKGGASAYLAKARGFFTSWWGMAMAGNTTIHQAIRNVWRQ